MEMSAVAANNVEKYISRVEEYRQAMLTQPNKDSVCTRALLNGDYDRKVISDFCRGAEKKDGNSDFNIISLIRLLYFPDLPDDIKLEIYTALSDFVFWPHNDKDGAQLQKIVYWSENHTLMLLSSAVLYRQKLRADGDKRRTRTTDLEHHLLLCYLRAHVECDKKGVYEVLSFVYLPYTLCALLNLIDFCKDPELVSLANRLADIIITQMMHVTASSGVCSLAVAARTYKRFRLRTFGHAVNHFIYCMSGRHANAPIDLVQSKIATKGTNTVSGYGSGNSSASAVRPAEPPVVEQQQALPGEDEDEHDECYQPRAESITIYADAGTARDSKNRAELGPSRLGDFICTSTKYLPPAEAFEALQQQGFRQMVCNPSLSELHDYFAKYCPAELQLVDTGAAPSAAVEGHSASTTHTAAATAVTNTGAAADSASASAAEDTLTSSAVTLKELQDAMLPFFWSAGLLVHPAYANRTKQYVARLNLSHNVHLWPLSWLSGGMTMSLSGSLKAWTEGQCYINMKLNVYKDRRLVLSSLEDFNGGTVGYQQLPWALNFDGVGIWSQSGHGSENVGGFDVTNTHTPVVSQCKHVLVAAYSVPKSMDGSMLFSDHVRLFWPCPTLRDDEVRTNLHKPSGSYFSQFKKLVGARPKRWDGNSWWFAHRRGYFVGIYCTHETTADSSPHKDSLVEMTRGAPKMALVVRQCTAKRHAWVCVVGRLSSDADAADAADDSSCRTFRSFEDFMSYCKNNIIVSPSNSNDRSKPFVVAVSVKIGTEVSGVSNGGTVDFNVVATVKHC